MATTNTKTPGLSPELSVFTKIKKYVTVEPILLAFGIPFYLQSISVQNFALEKSCRVNLPFSTNICDNMIDKSMNGINCGDINVMVEQLNQTVDRFEDAQSTYYNVTHSLRNISFEQEVCRAEIESQKLISTISGTLAPLESVIGLVIVLIGGYWSDTTGRRKPLILYPIVGEFLALLVFLVNASFMTVLPVQFGAISTSLIAAISGGENLMWMGIFCYVTEVTPEKDRVFRLGVLYQLYPLMAICTLPFSGILYKRLGYIKLILISLLFEACGILYLMIILKEPLVLIDKNEQIDEQSTQSTAQIDEEARGDDTKSESLRFSLISRKVVDAFRNVSIMLMRRRNGMGRTIVWLLLFCSFLYIGCEYEIVNQYFFVRTKLNWEALEESPFAAYASGTAFCGNILMTTVFSKYFRITDTVIGLVSSMLGTVAKLIYITVSTTFMLYVGRSFDMFSEVSNVANRCILSTLVDQNEIGRIFSLMALLDNFSKFVFLPIYANVYKYTVDTFPNAYFIVSFGGMTIVTAIFGALGSALVTPVFEKERVLPVPIWFPLDWQNNLLYYWFAYIFSTLGQLSLVVLNSFIPIFIWFLMYGNALKLKLLGDRVSKLGYQSFDEKRTIGQGTEYQSAGIRSLHNYIKLHKEISQDIRGIQDTFSLTFLIQIATSGICICSVTYLMASENLTNNYNNFVMYVSLMGIYNYEISLLMFYGNEVTLASEDLLGSVYQSNWMDLSIKYRKLLLILMERLKRPQEMLIGKMFPLNLKLLTSILNLAYTFFNVLRSSDQGGSPYKKSH